MDSKILIRHGKAELISSKNFLISGTEPVEVEIHADGGSPLKMLLCFDKDTEIKDTNIAPKVEVVEGVLKLQVGHFTNGGNKYYWTIGSTDNDEEDILLIMHIRRMYPNEDKAEVRRIILSFYKRNKVPLAVDDSSDKSTDNIEKVVSS